MLHSNILDPLFTIIRFYLKNKAGDPIFLFHLFIYMQYFNRPPNSANILPNFSVMIKK